MAEGVAEQATLLMAVKTDSSPEKGSRSQTWLSYYHHGLLFQLISTPCSYQLPIMPSGYDLTNELIQLMRLESKSPSGDNQPLIYEFWGCLIQIIRPVLPHNIVITFLKTEGFRRVDFMSSLITT